MRAPVYRNAEARSTFLGLAFPLEVLVVASVFWLSMLTLPVNVASLVTLGVYVGIRAATAGRPEAFVQHFVQWQVRRGLWRGLVSASARALTPPFPRGGSRRGS